MRGAYGLSNYDEHLCLKPPLLLWLAVIYLSRAIALPLLLGIAPLAGVSSDAVTLGRSLWSIDALGPSLIAATVLYAMVRRSPTTSTPVRWIWAHGRMLLTVSAGAHIVLAVVSLLRHGELDETGSPALVTAAVDLYFLVYVLAARRVRDTFADFPPPLDPVPR